MDEFDFYIRRRHQPKWKTYLSHIFTYAVLAFFVIGFPWWLYSQAGFTGMALVVAIYIYAIWSDATSKPKEWH